LRNAGKGLFSGRLGRLPAGSVARGTTRPSRPARGRMASTAETTKKEAGPRTLGRPLDIGAAAEVIGCSPWTVRQRLIPSGLPHFRCSASGKLIFYSNQLVAWILKQQGGNLP